MSPEWRDSALLAGAVEAWDADLAGALVRRGSRSAPPLTSCAIRLDRRVLALVDQLLRPVVEAATVSGGDAQAEVRSANAEVSVQRWILASKRARVAGSLSDADASLMTLPMLVQRFDDSRRHTLADIAVTLPSDLVDELDAEIRAAVAGGVTPDVMDPDDLAAWIGDVSVWDDLRAVVIEAPLRAWLLLRGVDPDQPAQPKRSRGRRGLGVRRDPRR
jgi:hypothetical protein